MATARHWYTLVGFSDELDWRQLAFVEPIPPNRICKACGLVTRVTAFLPCLHVFCRNCYEQCRHDDQHSCPLDGQLTVGDDVEWIEFPVENLLKRKVKCWNEDYGCDLILPASELHKHFYKQCDHHCTSCPKCSMIVCCNNVCSHMQSKCRDHVMCVVPRNLHAKTNSEKGIVMKTKANVDKRAGEMKVMLDHLKLENNVQSNRLDDISHCMNTIKETMLEILNKTNRFDSVASSSEAINEALNDQGEKLQQIVGATSTLRKTLYKGLRTLEQLKQDMPGALEAHFRELFTVGSVALQETLRKEFVVAARKSCSNCAESVGKIAGVKECLTQADSSAINSEKMLPLINEHRREFTIEGYKAKKESTSLEGKIYWGENIHSSDKLISPGVYFLQDGNRAYLYPYIQVHKRMTEDPLYLLKEMFQMTIKHPTQNKECREIIYGGMSAANFVEPHEIISKSRLFLLCRFDLNKLEREGYVVDDKLRVVCELVSED